MSGNRVRELFLREHSTTRAVELSQLEAADLAASPARLRVTPTRERGRYDVRASHLVGAITVRGLQVTIRPKLPVPRLLFLLGHSESAGLLGDVVRLSEEPDLVEMVQHHYAELLGRTVARGLVNDYREREEDLRGLRGRADPLDAVARKFGIVPPLRCRFDEFELDTDANRVLLSAARLLIAVGRPGPARATLEGLSSRFLGVSWVRYSGADVPVVVRDRRMEHYAPALGMAELLLRNVSVDLAEGDAPAGSFIIDMNRVFEDFVACALGQAVGAPGAEWIRQPPRLFLDEARRLPIEPDVLWKRMGPHAPIALDVKYKDLTREGRSPEGVSADVYQIVAYGNSVGAADAVLVYARCEPRVHVIRRSGLRVHLLEINPSLSPNELNAQVRRVATSVRGLARLAPVPEHALGTPAG